MRSNRFHLTSPPLLQTIGIAALAIAALTSLTVSTSAQPQPKLQTDNFDNNPTMIGWATSACADYPASFTFVNDFYSGKALRIVATNVSVARWNDATNNAVNFPGGPLRDTSRAILWMTNQTYSTNFYIAVDLVDWNTSFDRSTNDPVIGLIAHGTNIVRPVETFNTPATDVPGALGQSDGVVLCMRTTADGGGSAANGTRGQLEMYGIHAGFVQGLLNATCQGDYTLNPGHKYRLIFTGTNLWDPTQLAFTNQCYWGRVYDIQDLTRPLSTIRTDETLWPNYSGNCDGCKFSTAGYSGIFAAGYNVDTPPDVWVPRAVDMTIDNFVAANDPPSWLALPATPYGNYSGFPVPQVVNRKPASWSNFYAPAGGITFNATTFTNLNVTNISLFVNGSNVSSSLTISGPLTNRVVSYLGLTTNTVYDARIELADLQGRKTTNIWTFDTFTDAYLASAVCMNIECEDFDFNNGSFIDNPVPSGYTWNTTSNNILDSVNPPWPDPINGGPNSYVLKLGVNAMTNNGVGDFYEYDDKDHVGENVYRPLSIGTELGCTEALCYTAARGGSYGVVYTADTQRHKYSNVDPDLQEYILERTQGGEWANYTRTFYGTNYYNVYLRHGCELSQQLSLDVIAGSTTHLGEFYTTNAFGKSNFRYAPLLDGSGKLAVVNLSGVNKLRLTVDVPHAEKYREGLSLNYMAFVPAKFATVTLLSSSQPNTGYSIDSTASVNTVTKTITVPLNGNLRYYRLLWSSSTTIKSITTVGGNAVITYQ